MWCDACRGGTSLRVIPSLHTDQLIDFAVSRPIFVDLDVSRVKISPDDNIMDTFRSRICH